MLIRDLEAKFGLDRVAIRFYEKVALIAPERKESGYRNYTNENLNHLLKI
ncbi:MAG: MerR family transcriptional regulator [Clostridia bacterium]|nr:MerR family transcriptional regulator [Clostridia bacterium]